MAQPQLVLAQGRQAQPGLLGGQAHGHQADLAQALGAQLVLGGQGRRFVVEALQAGASGFLPKDCAVDELATAIRTMLRGQIFLSSQISGEIITDYLHLLKEAKTSVFTVLTPREREVLQMLAEGKTTKYMALALGVSAKTIETYRQQIMDKLELRSIAELTKYAIREGLTSLEH